jgi:hypothetical protein
MVVLHAGALTAPITDTHCGLEVKGTFITVVRRSSLDSTVYCYLKKGDTVKAAFAAGDTTSFLRIYRLILPT